MNTSIAFCFCGQGGQNDQMGLDLYHSSNTFCTFLQKLDREYSIHSGLSILELSKIQNTACPDKPGMIDEAILRDSGLSMVLSSFIQLGLVYILQKANIIPRYTLGHSNGEFVAMYSRLDLNDEHSIRLITGIIYARCVLMKEITPGEMMVAKASEEEMKQLITDTNTEVWVSAINAEHAVTVSGKTEQIERLYLHCKSKGVKVTRLAAIKYPFHSPWMNDYANRFEKETQSYFNECHKVLAPLGKEVQARLHCSSVDGSVFETFPEGYWKQNITQPVQFLKACQSLSVLRPDIILEISPTPVLHNFLKTNISNGCVRCVQDDSCETLDASFVSVIVDMAKMFEDFKKQVNWTFLLNEFQSTKCQELLTSLNKN
jgi:acyl transferase domain-containing protein